MTETRNLVCQQCLREPRVPGALRCTECEQSWQLRHNPKGNKQ